MLRQIKVAIHRKMMKSWRAFLKLSNNWARLYKTSRKTEVWKCGRAFNIESKTYYTSDCQMLTSLVSACLQAENQLNFLLTFDLVHLLHI